MAYPGYKKWEALQVRYTKSGGGGGASGPIYEKWGGGGGGGVASDPIYEKWGGGGGGGAFRFRYLWALRKYLHVPTYVLPRYTSHARANEYMSAKVLSSIC